VNTTVMLVLSSACNLASAPQRFDDDHIAAFHVGYARAANAVALALPTLDGTVLFEHGIEGGRSKEAACPACLTRRHEMARPWHAGGKSTQRVGSRAGRFGA